MDKEKLIESMAEELKQIKNRIRTLKHHEIFFVALVQDRSKLED